MGKNDSSTPQPRLLLPHDLVFHAEEHEQDFLFLALADAILVECDEHVIQDGDIIKIVSTK